MIIKERSCDVGFPLGDACPILVSFRVRISPLVEPSFGMITIHLFEQRFRNPPRRFKVFSRGSSVGVFVFGHASLGNDMNLVAIRPAFTRPYMDA